VKPDSPSQSGISLSATKRAMQLRGKDQSAGPNWRPKDDGNADILLRGCGTRVKCFRRQHRNTLTFEMPFVWWRMPHDEGWLRDPPYIRQEDSLPSIFSAPN
jgi:hypothetical protein